LSLTFKTTIIVRQKKKKNPQKMSIKNDFKNGFISSSENELSGKFII